jgi:hypothetical protein
MADSHDTRTMTFPEMQALADRLIQDADSIRNPAAAKVMGGDMKLAAAAIRGLLARCVVAGETAGELGLNLTAAVTLGRC